MKRARKHSQEPNEYKTQERVLRHRLFETAKAVYESEIVFRYSPITGGITQDARLVRGEKD
jgi:hypothetical protein